MDACPGNILESTKEIETKLGLLIDDSERKGFWEAFLASSNFLVYTKQLRGRPMFV